MENTLLTGDHILASTFPKPQPAHGDIVVFYYPIDHTQIYIKRIIGLPGDHIRIASGVVYRNSVAVTEPYAVHRYSLPERASDNLPGKLPDVAMFRDVNLVTAARDMLEHHVENGELVVPPGKYFVLGDNRDVSLDSRYWGFVDSSELIGKALFIYESEAAPEAYPGANRAWIHRIRWNRVFKTL